MNSAGLNTMAGLIRHCGFCLKEMIGDTIFLCEKCLRRAYCSKECQLADWSCSPNKKGQGHMTWCGTNYGEEDLDWKVSPVPGKGLGIMALRDLPKAYPILVEAPVEKTHPRVVELMPLGATIDEKFELNKFITILEEDYQEHSLFLRVSRLNHSCVPNAALFYINIDKVMILVSLRDLKKDEEICISYVVGPLNLSETRTPEMIRENLRLKWGIVCNPNCLCFHDRFYCEKIKFARVLEKAMRLIVESGSVGNADVESYITTRLGQLERNGGLRELSVIGLKRTVELGFQILPMEVNSALSLIEFLTNELFEPMQEHDRNRADDGNGRDTRNSPGQPFCAYMVDMRIPIRLINF